MSIFSEILSTLRPAKRSPNNPKPNQDQPMKITPHHPASIGGMPVILGYHGGVMDYGPGIKMIRAKLGISLATLAEKCRFPGQSPSIRI